MYPDGDDFHLVASDIAVGARIIFVYEGGYGFAKVTRSEEDNFGRGWYIRWQYTDGDVIGPTTGSVKGSLYTLAI